MLSAAPFTVSAVSPRSSCLQVATAPPGAQAAGLDLIKAYRASPIIPAHKCYLPYFWSGGIWVEHCAPFGFKTAGNIQGVPADAFVDTCASRNMNPIVKWVDDLNIFRFPLYKTPDNLYVYPYDMQDIFAVSGPLGMQWHPFSKKGHDFAFLTTYAGFDGHLPLRRVILPEKKRLKHLLKAQRFLDSSRSKVQQKQVSSIHGTLQHDCFIFRDGRSYLPGPS